MNEKQKYIIDTIRQHNEKAVFAAMNGGTSYFEPLRLALPNTMKSLCPHCHKKIKVDHLTLSCNSGVMSAAQDLPAETVSVIANCPDCGSRIALSLRDVKKGLGEGSRTVRNAVVAAVLVLALGGTGVFVVSGKMQAKYYQQARAEMRSGDYESAVENLNRAKRFGSADAVYLLSECYANGTGVAQDADKAQELLEEAAKKGSELASYAVAMRDFEQYLQDGSNSALQACLDELQGNESGEALYQLSLMTRVGIGVSQSMTQANELLRQAAEKGYVNAMCDYAQKLVYAGQADAAKEMLDGYVDQEDLDIQAAKGFVALFSGDVSSGMQQISNAAAAGGGYGNLYMGDMYYNGTVAARDRVRAYDYYLASANAGNYEGKVGLAMCTALDETGHRNDEEAAAMAKDCYNRGYVDAACLIGYFHHTGNAGFVVDSTEAMRYTMMAADNYYAPAEILMAGMVIASDPSNASRCEGYLQAAYDHGALTEANLQAMAYLGRGSEYFGPNTLS